MDMSWQDIGASLMEVYSQRTNGTFVLRKGSCVLWHYGDADPDFGASPPLLPSSSCARCVS